ncbi:MAG: hypothetical protein P8077_07905, partial [Gammaproteobacteria bacterium]
TANPHGLNMIIGCESLRAVLENSDLFGQLESANPDASGWDGIIGRDDIKEILKHPNHFPPVVVNAAKVIDQYFTKINKRGNGLIKHWELVAFQKNLSEKMDVEPANPVKPRIIEHFDFGDELWRDIQIANNKKNNHE